ncbi:MAG TPA: polysaccharide deacetylase family protein [candidate division Zixibacteria bacterium]|nr:polysaccharide deacetylase family protein [candidate division Zixibacteria bacterium]
MKNERTEALTIVPFAPMILTFHRVSHNFTWSATNYRPERIISLLTQLESAGFVFIPLSDEISSKPAGERHLAITFDDGMAELADELPPLIDRFGLKPTVFMPTAFIGRTNRWDYSYRLAPSRHLNRDEISRLADAGVEFGSHGHTHRCFRNLPVDVVADELRQSRTILEEILGKTVDSISYPFGRIDDTLLKLVAEAGYTHGYTMRYPAFDDRPLALGRMAVYSFDNPASVQRKLGSGFGHRIERVIAAFTNRLSGGTVLLQRFRSFHL